jgi:hypothetical protein
MDIHQLIIGRWKDVNSNIILTFEAGLNVYINTGSFANMKLFCATGFNSNFKRYQITAPEIGLHIAFIKSITNIELIIDNVHASAEQLRIDPKSGDFINDFSRIIFYKAV